MNGRPTRVLIVDDESSIRSALPTTLGGLGFDVTEATREEEAVSLLHTMHFDVALLDINMSGIGGVETCRRIRNAAPRLSILMLTVHHREEDKVEALESGADDYITKPFQIRELIARLRAGARRSQIDETAASAVIRIGDLELDADRRILTKAGNAIHFTPKEFDLLHCMMSNAGRPVRHAKLLQAVWGREYGEELEYLRTFFRELRKKIEDDPANPRYLLTEIHFGYRFSQTVC